MLQGHSQNCPRLGQNPTSAFPVCGTTTFVQNSVPLCVGSNIPGPCSQVTDRNPYWYSFTCYVAGTLGFLITPNNLADDYDWQLFDITGRNRDDVYTDPSLFVACNWSGFGGITGASSAGTSLINCGGNFPIFSSMPSLIAGHDYLLMISHYTNTQSGYQLSFTMGTPGGGTAAITDPANPIPEVSMASVSCDGTQIVVHINKKVKCSSLALDGSDFIISPSGIISSALGYGCSTGFDMDSVLLTLSASLAPGNYTVAAANGNDGNTLLDNCDRTIVVGDDATFTVNPPAPLPMGTVTPPACTPVSLTLTFADLIKCNSVAVNGSDFTITGPSAVTVSSATPVNCNANGETNTITLQVTSAIVAAGTYQVNAATGSDGNTIIGNCNRQVSNGANTSFTIAPQTPVAMGSVTPPPCTPSSITLTFAEPVLCSSIAANGTDFIITGPAAVSIISAAAVNCNTNGETTTITVQLSAPILVTGPYNVQMATGTDGNTLTGNCLRQITAGELTPFTLSPQPAIAMGTVAIPSCTPQSITLNFPEPILCNSVAANGSDFTISGPSPVTISSAAAVNCNANGETTTITIQLSGPILATGSYNVQMTFGTDGNTLTGQCNRRVPAGVSAQFILAPQPPLPMGTIPPPNCSPSSITLNFTDNILCTSIAADGSDFIITGQSAVVITSATGMCNATTTAITLQLAAPIVVSGNYQLQMMTGSDGNTLTGICNRQTTAGEFASFTIPAASPVAMDSLVPIACSPSSLKLIFAAPIRCSSVAPDGSDFIITNGPSAVTVASASGTCDANGFTTSIDIRLASPVVRGGLYQLQLVNGSDGNTLLSDCNRQTPAGSSINFTAIDTVSAEFQYQVQYDCETDVITFSHDGQHNVNQWTWTVNGTAVSSLSTFTQSFSAASQNQVQLVVSNGVCNDTYSASVVLNNKVTVDFELPESVCPEDTVIFRNRSTGQIDYWQWTFGNGNTGTIQNPPAQIYPLTGAETLYTVSLTAGSNNGCRATATRTLKVLPVCIIAVPSAFTPNNDGKNDYLYPLNAIKAENLDFKVFNRGGQLIFHSKDWRQKWDGRVAGVMQATGVYIWMLEFTNKDTKQKYSMKGTTTLIR